MILVKISVGLVSVETGIVGLQPTLRWSYRANYENKTVSIRKKLNCFQFNAAIKRLISEFRKKLPREIEFDFYEKYAKKLYIFLHI